MPSYPTFADIFRNELVPVIISEAVKKAANKKGGATVGAKKSSAGTCHVPAGNSTGGQFTSCGTGVSKTVKPQPKKQSSGDKAEALAKSMGGSIVTDKVSGKQVGRRIESKEYGTAELYEDYKNLHPSVQSVVKKISGKELSVQLNDKVCDNLGAFGRCTPQGWLGFPQSITKDLVDGKGKGFSLALHSVIHESIHTTSPASKEIGSAQWLQFEEGAVEFKAKQFAQKNKLNAKSNDVYKAFREPVEWFDSNVAKIDTVWKKPSGAARKTEWNKQVASTCQKLLKSWPKRDLDDIAKLDFSILLDGSPKSKSFMDYVKSKDKDLLEESLYSLMQHQLDESNGKLSLYQMVNALKGVVENKDIIALAKSHPEIAEIAVNLLELKRRNPMQTSIAYAIAEAARKTTAKKTTGGGSAKRSAGGTCHVPAGNPNGGQFTACGPGNIGKSIAGVIKAKRTTDAAFGKKKSAFGVAVPKRREKVSYTPQQIKQRFRKATKAERKKIGMEDTAKYPEVLIAKDPNEYRQISAKRVDANGKLQSANRYHSDTVKINSKVKYARTRTVLQMRDDAIRPMDEDAANGNHIALIASTIAKTGMRPGKNIQRGEKEAYGAITVQMQHATVGKNGVVVFSFPGKGGTAQSYKVKDKTLADHIRNRRKAGAKGTDRVFPKGNPDDVNKYIKRVTGADITAKDFRTARGTELAMGLVKKMKAPRNELELKEAKKQVAAKVSEYLGNEPQHAINSYIDPTVFKDWER